MGILNVNEENDYEWESWTEPEKKNKKNYILHIHREKEIQKRRRE